MHLGVDFDNTIVNYDSIFYRVAKEQGLIPNSIPISKLAVRNHLREQNKENLWTEMQAYVYGAKMLEAEPFPGVLESLWQIKNMGFKISIVSHKTQYPYAGTQYNLHDSAHAWIKNILNNGENLISTQDIYFEKSKQDKIQRIKDAECDWFVDDLTEILLAENFPENVHCFLFDPNSEHAPNARFRVLSQWLDLKSLLI